MSRAAKRRRQREQRRTFPAHGKYLTDLQFRECMVIRHVHGRDIGKPRRGWMLTADLVYQDSRGRLHVLEAGYVWDGPSYPDWLRRIAGERSRPSLLAASAFHDAFGADYKVLYQSHGWHTPQLYDPGIFVGALLYAEMIRSYPSTTIGMAKRTRQVIGLLLGQRWFRLLSGGKHATWRKYEN